MPLMIYVFSDGSLVSSGMTDNSVGGRGKGVWMADNTDDRGLADAGLQPEGQARPRSCNQIGSTTMPTAR